jgi:hypothetical protein
MTYVRTTLFTLLACILLASPAIAQSTKGVFHFQDGDGYRDLLYGDTPVWRDMIKYDPADRENTYKPYKHIFGFNGEGFITKGPGGLYPHHRGIFFGFKTFDSDEAKTLLGDFWHCPEPAGITQQHVKFLPEREIADGDQAREAQVVDWVAKDGKPVVRDTREFTIRRISDKKYIIDCAITVETLTGRAITLGGDAHHAGLHFRAAQSIADDKDPKHKGGSATYIRPATAKLIKDDIYSGCPWVHCSFDIQGHHYQLTHMDGPGNPTPTTYSTRPYGRVGAFFTAPVTPDKPLKLHYRLELSEGDPPTPEQLAAAYESYRSSLAAEIAGGK